MACAFLILALLARRGISGSEAVKLITSENFERLVDNYELVFLNFFAAWCRFSQMLEPIFEDAAAQISSEFPQPGKVLFGKVDCENEKTIAHRFHISKYPTLKIIRRGKLMKREYRGQRSVHAIASYIRSKLNNSLDELRTAQDFEKVDDNKRAVLAYISDKRSLPYYVFSEVAMDLRDDCQFFVGNTSSNRQFMMPNAGKILFKSDRTKYTEQWEQYPGNTSNYKELLDWLTSRCIPLVREITFENAEELTEEGLPFLILFHHANDKESVDIYIKEIQNQLTDDKNSINFLIADGEKFSHPLRYLGKTQKDLPLIAIDSFRHMFLFSPFQDITIPGKLKHFVRDFYSGTLHKNFHSPPAETQTQDSIKATQAPKQETKDSTQQVLPLPRQADVPPDSIFKHLSPSRYRYTLLRDEL